MTITNTGVTHIPITCDLEIQPERASGSYVFRSSNTSDGAAKSSAVVQLSEATSADVIVDPVFSVDRSSGNITVTVSGYPAVYRNFRNVQPEELELLEAGRLTRPVSIVASDETVGAPNKKTGVVVVSILGTIALLLLLL